MQKTHNLPIENIVGQSYDGAGNMWGCKKGVSTLIQKDRLYMCGAAKALENPEYWHTPFSIPDVCKQGAVNTI